MNSTHQTRIVRIEALLEHPNADLLSIVHIGGYQVVTRKEQFKVGDLAVYVQPDSVVPQTDPFRFIWEAYIGLDGTVPENRRRVTVRKFRKEWSEGLLLPMDDFSTELVKAGRPEYHEGDDLSDILGITHYEPEEMANTKGETASAPRLRYPKTLKGWFYFLVHKLGFKGFGKQLTEEIGVDIPAYDVEALKNYAQAFEPGEMVYVTEKIHGSNARFLFLDGHMYAGSHYQWKHEKSTCAFRKALTVRPWIEQWCRAHEGTTLYGELTPTQKGFSYGSNELRFFAFDIRTPEGQWRKPWTFHYEVVGVDESNHSPYTICHAEVNIVPVLYYGPYDLEKIKAQFVDGPSAVLGAKNMREGVVITPVTERTVRGLGRLQLKLVSNAYLEKDSKESFKDGAPE